MQPLRRFLNGLSRRRKLELTRVKQNTKFKNYVSSKPSISQSK